MKFIDKSQRKEEGEKIISEFLDCFHQRTKAYPDDMYNAFCSEIDDSHNHITFSKRLRNEVLSPEQNGRCCYCMRQLSTCNRVTIEHIMPNHATDKPELDTYRLRKTELDGIPHSKDFKTQAPIVYPPHPHSIAYQNLTLSCDGVLIDNNSRPICCNLKRGHRFLPPFILYPDIEQKFKYSESGIAEWTEDPEQPESPQNVTRTLGLNTQLLRMIRRIWFFCSDNELDPRKDEKNTIINTIMGYMAGGNYDEREINMLLNFKQDKYWNLLLSYDAFADISHN